MLYTKSPEVKVMEYDEKGCIAGCGIKGIKNWGGLNSNQSLGKYIKEEVN